MNQIHLSKIPIVTEFFSFYSPHSSTFEPIICQVKEQLPRDVKLKKNHVSSIGGSMGISMSKAYASMVVLKIDDKMVPVMFNRIYKLRRPPNNDEELRQVFLDEGIDEKKFNAAFQGFAVDSMIRRFDKEYQNTGRQDMLLPIVTVNNKYLVTAEGLQNIEQYIELVNYLLTLK